MEMNREASGTDYEVFLSFRGPDTRQGLAAVLYDYMVNAGIRVFRDDDELAIGNKIETILQAIEGSQICVPIFSKTFAESKWCLREVRRMVKLNKEVVPIFYDVTPADVKLKTPVYKNFMMEHETKYGKNKVEKWEGALKAISKIKGREVLNTSYPKFCKMFIEELLINKLKPRKRFNLDKLVGMDNQLDSALKQLDIGGGDVGYMLIHGMGGIGKTTLAKVMFDKISASFDGCCFLEGLRESARRDGLDNLQKQLGDSLDPKSAASSKLFRDVRERFRGKKVLIILDDVDTGEQVDKLVGKSSFGFGSRIIITTRKKDVLDECEDLDEGSVQYLEMGMLQHDEALKLFMLHAFRGKSPPAIYESLADEAISNTGGLPLAIRVIASHLREKSEGVWRDVIARLGKIPPNEVKCRLRTSYDELECEQKQIFLDIACFFIGTDTSNASYMWEACDLYPRYGLAVLASRSLVKITDENALWMHDQLRDLGRDIVRDENINDPTKRSRIWLQEDGLEALLRTEGSRKIEAIDLNVETRMEDYCFAPKNFRDLSNLRFLQLIGADLAGDFLSLLPKLRWLRCRISSTDNTATNLDLKNLVVLDLSCSSRLAHDWTAFNSIQIAAVKLRVLQLDHCSGLTRTPDFSKFQNLERLSLRYCSSLGVVDPSIGKLKRLTSLNMEGCEKIEELPQEFDYLKSLCELVVDGTRIKELPALGNMKRLEILSAKWCEDLDKLPDSIGQVTSLSDLVLDGTGITELPGSIGSLVNLRRLTLANTPLSELPMSIGGLKSLTELVLSWTRVASLPVSIGNLNNLEVLEIDQTQVRCLPAALGELERLRVLDASECPLCEEIPIELGRLSLLKVLLLRGTKISAIPETIKGLPLLEVLDVAHCYQLTILPELPTSLVEVSVTCRSTAPIPNLSDLINLKKLEFIESTVPKDIMQLPKLEKLHISSPTCRFIQNGIGMLSMLKKLSIDNITIPYLPKLPCGLRKLSITHSASLERLADLSNLQSLSDLRLKCCPQLVEIKGLGSLLSLRSFSISRCEAIHNLNGLDELEKMFMLNISGCNIIERLSMSGLKLLQIVNACWCQKLEGLDGLDELENLWYLNIGYCKSIERLPDLSNLKFLTYLQVCGCENLQGLDGLDKLEALMGLHISECKAIQRLPDLSSLRLLRELSADGCENLQELEGLENLKRLERLDASGYVAIENLPNLSKLKKLKWLNVSGCKMLREIQGLEELELIEVINIAGCNLLQKLPDLPNARIIDDSIEVQQLLVLKEKLTSWNSKTISMTPLLMNRMTLTSMML